MSIFNRVKLTRPKKNVFDLSHDFKFSFNQGELIPTLAMECVPGDEFKLGCDTLLRFQALVAPVMHRYDITTHYFFVPNRLLWKNWETFIMNKKDEVTNLPPAFPTVTVSQETNSPTRRFLDYLGVPPHNGSIYTAKISALPMAAYNFIYNEYYRDQNLIEKLPYELVDVIILILSLCRLS